MAKPHKNNPDDFPEFNLNQLECYAEKWVEEYSVIQIQKITLYRLNTKYQEKWLVRYSLKCPITQYALVFEYSGVQDPDAVDIGCQEFGLEPLESNPIDGEDSFITALKKIKFADQFADQGYHRLLDSCFAKTVYREKPSSDYFRNWMYCLKQHASSEDQLPRGILTNKPYWIIYQKKIDQIQPKRKLLETRISTSEVLTILGNKSHKLKMHQLFRLMKEGHLQAYDNLGRKVVDLDSCEKGKKKLYERIEELIRIREGTKLAGNVTWDGVIEKPLTKEEIKREAREEYNTQPSDTPINPDPEHCVLFDFKPSEKNFIKTITFEFGENEVLNLIKEKTLLKSEPEQRPTEQVPTYTKDTAIAFYQDGDVWKIGEKGSEKTFNHLNGFNYIAYLIKHKNKEFKPMEVFYYGNIPKEVKHLNKIDYQKIGNTSDLKKCIKILEEKLEVETDPNKRIDQKDRIKNLIKLKDEGLKRFKQKSEACRKTVYKSIKTATKKIQKEIPSFKKYFNYGKSEVIKTGSVFSYQHFNFGLLVQWMLNKPE